MTNIVVEGLCGIRAEVVLDNISPSGERLTTLLVDMPRIVHAEYLKHRVFSNSAASSRAIPFEKMQKQLTGRPVRFGEANSGMQDKGIGHDALVAGWVDPSGIGEDGYYSYFTPTQAWNRAKDSALAFAEAFKEAGYHKQVYNRLTEPFQMIRVLTTATEWDNFEWLRADGAADPTIEEAARVMLEAKTLSKPQLLQPGEWHLPFVEYYNEVFPDQDTFSDEVVYGPRQYFIGNIHDETFQSLTLDEAIKVSCARCAATSFRNTDYDLDKSLQVYDRLVNGDKVHAGALEHCGTPMREYYYEHGFSEDYTVNAPTEPSSWEPGISHMDRNGQLWSGNFKGFIQYRKLVPNENYTGAP